MYYLFTRFIHFIDNSEDDLEISVAVAAAEPDISQLMEDLEQLAKEREELLAVNSDYNQNIQSNKGSNMRRSVDGSKLSDLENNIREKEEVINKLTNAEVVAKETAMIHEQRANELELESEQLRIQLQQLSKLKDDRNHTNNNYEEEVKKRQQYELKLREAEDQILMVNEQKELIMKMENERKQIKLEQSQLTSEHLKELEAFRNESKRLNEEVINTENKQRKTLELLSQQVSQYMKKSVESEELVSKLQQENSDLVEKLSKLLSESVKPGDNINDADSKNTERDSERYIKTRGDKDAYNPMNSSVVNVSNSADAIINENDVQHWLQSRINALCTARLIAIEIQRLSLSCASLRAEKEEILKEIQPIKNKQFDSEAQIKKKIQEVSKKMDQLITRYNVLKYKIQSSNSGEGNEEEGSMKLLDEYEETKFSIASYKEHKSELEDRLLKGVLPADLELKLQELQEEMQTIDTEIDLSHSRIRQEKSKLKKLLPNTADSNVIIKKLISISDGIDYTTNSTVEPIENLDDLHIISEYSNWLVQDLYNSLKLPMNSTKNHSNNESALQLVVKFIARMLLSEEFRSKADDLSIRQLQQQLDDKKAENDELTKLMQRSRNDLKKKLDQQKRESDDKIAFLLQQLRSVESKNLSSGMNSARSTPSHKMFENESDNRSSSTAVGLPNVPPRPKSAINVAPNTARVPSVPTASMDLNDDGLRLSASIMNSPVSMGTLTTGRRKITDSLFAEQLKMDPTEMNREVMQRWLAEKERRELLEKKTLELSKELRLLRQQQQQSDNSSKGKSNSNANKSLDASETWGDTSLRWGNR